MKNKRLLIAATALILALALFAGFLATSSYDSIAVAASVPQQVSGDVTDGASPSASHRLIVELESQPLAVWADSRARDSAGRLDVNSAPAQTYIAQLQADSERRSHASMQALTAMNKKAGPAPRIFR